MYFYNQRICNIHTDSVYIMICIYSLHYENVSTRNNLLKIRLLLSFPFISLTTYFQDRCKINIFILEKHILSDSRDIVTPCGLFFTLKISLFQLVSQTFATAVKNSKTPDHWWTLTLLYCSPELSVFATQIRVSPIMYTTTT